MRGQKSLKLKEENGQKVFTACRRRFEVCGRAIGMDRLIIDQLRWHAVDQHALTSPAHHMPV